MNEKPILSFEQLTIRYPSLTHPAVSELSLDVMQGQITMLVGESGSGKSTLLRSVIGLQPAGCRMQGRILFEDKNLLSLSPGQMRALRGKKIGMIFQDAGLYLTPRRKIGAQFAEMLRAHFSISRKEALEIAKRELAELSLADPDRILDSFPFELSGGMKQRTAIGMAMALRPSLLLCDEPTSALDVTNGAQVARLLRDLCEKQGVSILMVTHNIGLAAAIGDRIAVMRQGNLVEVGTREQIIHTPHEEYTIRLLNAVPRLD